MNKSELEQIRESTTRSVLMMVNEISKLFDEIIMKENDDIPLLKEKTARLILAHLSHHSGATQQELVRITQMKGSTVSVAVGKMEKAGYLKREANEHDMRSVRVFLTQKGVELSDKIKTILKLEDEKIMHGIAERDIRATKYVLEKMLDNLIEQ